MPLGLSAVRLLLVADWRCVRPAVGGPDLRRAGRVGELSGGPAAPIPSPVFSHGDDPLEAKPEREHSADQEQNYPRAILLNSP